MRHPTGEPGVPAAFVDGAEGTQQKFRANVHDVSVDYEAAKAILLFAYVLAEDIDSLGC